MTDFLYLTADFSRITDPGTGRALDGHRMIEAAEGLARAGFRKAMLEEIDIVTGGSAATEPETTSRGTA